MHSTQPALSVRERVRLYLLRGEIQRGERNEHLTPLEYSHLRFHQWRLRRLCPCGYDWDGCRCLTDAADEIAH